MHFKAKKKTLKSNFYHTPEHPFSLRRTLHYNPQLSPLSLHHYCLIL
jgi:hypothetical protein